MAECLDEEKKLTLGHVPYFVEHLSKFAYKWRNIGTALKFQPQDLRNIEVSPSLIATAPSSFMQRLVEEWLEGKYPHTAPPTLANLFKALNSHTVGLGTLATQIRNLLPQHDLSVDANVFEIAAMSNQGDITSNRIEDIRVIENTQVHLEIKTSSEKQLCRWSNTHLKNKQPSRQRNTEHEEEQYSSIEQLSRQRHEEELSKLCSGMNKPVVNILRADIDMDGSRFSCETEDLNTFSSSQIIPVTFRVSCPQLDELKDKLASIYLAQPEVPQDSWPPVSNKTYINLALIKQQQSIYYGGKYARLTIRGDMDDILHHKEIIEYENIFDGLRSGSLFLIEGRPGCGKTTFVNKITRDWAATEVKGPMRLVLLVSLRVLSTWDKPVTLEDILHLLNLRIEEKTLDDRNGKGVCFIFDGLDEFSPLEGENSIVYKIIYKTYLPESIVIVASRPAALVSLRRRADKIVEVIGFPRDQIFEYFENYFHFNRSKAVELRSYLTSHPNVLHICYLPIHAAMVAFLFEVMGKVPRTETEIYKHFTHSTLMRSLSKKKRQDELLDMDINELLSGEEKELYNTICESAFEITALNRQVLDQDKKMKLLLRSKEIDGIALGLVTVDRTASLYGFKNIYTFLHLTYQEYLAAVYISTLSDKDQQRLIEQYGDKDHMRVVWKFYFGLVNFEGHEYKIRALINRRKEMGLFDIQCAYESQQEIVCNFLMEAMDAQIMLEDKYLTTSDFTALGYLLANSFKPASLSLNYIDIDTEAVDAMLAEIVEKPFSLYSLHFVQNFEFNPEQYLRNITKLLLHQHGLKVFRLCRNQPDDIYATLYATLAHYLDDYDFHDIVSKSLVNLEEFSVSGLNVGPKTLSEVLQFCKELTSLSIYQELNCILDNIDTISVVNLKELYLCKVQITPKMLSSILQCCIELTSLTLNDCTEENAIQTLLSEFSKCKKLETVLCSSVICTWQGPEYHIEITKNTTKKFSKAHLYRQNNSVLYVQGVRSDYFQTLTSAIEIRKPFPTACLKSFLPSRIKVLELHQDSPLGSSYDEDTFPSIIECISDFSALEKLVLTGFKISHGAVLLADILGHCIALQEVDFSHFSETRGIETFSDCSSASSEGIESFSDCSSASSEGIESFSEGIKTILNGLRSCTNLEILTLNNSKIGIDDVCVLTSCLQHWPKLCDLNINGWYNIREEDYRTITDYIKSHCPNLLTNPIQTRKIHENSLLDDLRYCIEMCEKKKETKSSSQEASSCCIGEEGAEVFADNIEYCPEQTDLVEMRGENKSSLQEASSCSVGEERDEVFADNIECCPEQTDLVGENEETKPSLQKDYSCCCTLF